MNANEKPSNKGKIFFFINAWLLLMWPPKLGLRKLIQLATPAIQFELLTASSNKSQISKTPCGRAGGIVLPA
jgi:hypothetical protein